MKPKAFLAVALVAAIVTGAATAARAAGLPDGYTAVEYIESTGGQYIDTGVAAKTGVKVEARALWTTEDQDSAFIGARKNSEDTRFYPIWYYDGALSYGHKEWKPLSEAKVPANSVVDIVSDFTTAGQATIKVGSSEYQITGLGDAFDAGLTMYLGALNSGGSAGSGMQGRIYNCKIYEMQSGTLVLVRNFVPCVRESDLAVGLYDLAASDPSKAFYANAGSGVFGVPEGTFCTVTVGAIKNMTAAYTFGDGSVTNAVEGTTFGLLAGTTNLTVVFTAADGCRFADDSTVKTVTRDEVTGDLDLTAETPVAHKVQPMATITKITNRYPWNGKIDVEYELSNLGSAFDPIVALVTKFTSGDIEVTKTNDLSDAELAARTVCRTFDCRELFGEGKRDAQAQSAAKLSPLDYDYAVIDVSGGANATSYPVTYYKSAPEGGWNTDEYKTDKIVLYYVKEGKYWGNQKTEQTTTGFWIGVFSVTEAQYAKVMGSHDSTTKPKVLSVTYTTFRGTDNPNATVTGDSFLKRLCDRTGLDGFDLPTESQWEIACRAGTTTTYYWGNSESGAGQYMWYSGNSLVDKYRTTQGVGQKIPNAWGLYDMAGNVWEWCRDGYHDSLTVDSSADVCLDPEAGRYLGDRVLRGGSFDLDVVVGASSSRSDGVPGDGTSNWGFRLSRMCSKGKSGLVVNEQNGADDVWTTGPSFSFDMREEKTIAGPEVETLTYSGIGWGEQGAGTSATVTFKKDGGNEQTLLGATEGAGEVQWTVERGGKYVFTHKSGDAEETATFVVNGPFTVRVPKSIEHLTCAVYFDETPVGGNEDGQYVRYDIPGSGCTIVFTPTDGYLIRSGGELALPVRDKTLEDDDLPVLIAPGEEDNPWKVGAGGTDAVLAYVKNGVLVIVGSGAMDDFSDAASVPWTAVAGEVTAVTVADGVTYIGENAFAGLANTVTVNGRTVFSLKLVFGPSEPTPVPVPPEGAVTTWDALTNAVAMSASGAVIAVGADINEEGGELVVPKDREVAIKLYGKVVSCRCVTVGGALTVGDADDSVGRIVASNGAKVAKGGSVTLLGGPMRGTFTTLSPGLILLFK